MRGISIVHVVLGIVVAFSIPAPLALGGSDPNDPNRYLNAVREFADNVLKYGRDTYGPKHTPLFVDGLNINTHEPVKWIAPEWIARECIAPKGEAWILSNPASQQNLFRTLDGLTKITGDPKYKQAAMGAIKYAFGNLRSPNGLLHWGGHVAYDVLSDEMCAVQYIHELKYHYPYYELMWEVDPNATRQLIESFWFTSILDWSNLAMNRHGSMSENPKTTWNHEYKGGPVFFKSDGLSFCNTGSDLIYAGSLLYKLSGEREPLLWSKRLSHRYIETRQPQIGISGGQYTRIERDRAQSQFGDDFQRHLVLEGTLFPYMLGSSVPLALLTRGWICRFMLTDVLGSDGKQFCQEALEELTAWGKMAYRKKDNSFIPMLTDGTSLEGYTYSMGGYFGPQGTVVKSLPAPPIAFWAYALAFRVTGNDFMWEMSRNIAQGNDVGDIGASPKDNPDLRKETNCSDPYVLLSFLELHRRTGKTELLAAASRVADNILSDRLHTGFFIPSKEAIYAKFDYIEPLALLNLHMAANGKPSLVPLVWPSRSYFDCQYDGLGSEEDAVIIYCQTRQSQLLVLLRVAVCEGRTDEVKSLILKGADVNAVCKFDSSIFQRLLGMSGQLNEQRMEVRLSYSTPVLHYAVEKGHKDIVELLIAKGADVNAIRGYPAGDTPLHSAVRAGHKDIVELLIAKDADINIKTWGSQTPLDIARRQNRIDIVALLRQHGAKE